MGARQGHRFWPYLRVMLVALLVAGACWTARRFGLLETVELRALDGLLRLMPQNRSAAGDVVVIALDEIDIRALNHYPVQDEELLHLISQLLEWGAAGVGLDIVRDVPVPPGHDQLMTLLQKHPEIICVRGMGGGALAIRAPAIFEPPAISPDDAIDRVGFVDFPRDADGVVRRAQWYIQLDNQNRDTYCALSLLLANLHLEREGVFAREAQAAADQAPAHIQFWERTIPEYGGNVGAYGRGRTSSAGGGIFLMDWRGSRHPPLFRLRQAWPKMPLDPRDRDESSAAHPLTRAHVKGKLVLIGIDAVSLKDQIDTPLGVGRPGIKVHAAAVDNLLRIGRGASPVICAWGPAAESAWLIPWSMAGAAIAFLYRRPVLYAAGVLLGIGLLAFIAYAQLRWGYRWIPTIPPLLGLAATAGILTVLLAFQERREKTVIRDIFARTQHAEIMDELLRGYADLVEKGRLKPVRTFATVMFTDLQGFTQISEKMNDPDRLIQWLDSYWPEISTCVIDSGGMVIKFMGDGMMAVFGVPFYGQGEDHNRRYALAAVRCALSIRQSFHRQRAQWQRLGQPCPRMRIGIYSGDIVVGTVGSGKRIEFATLGDTVNTAARLEAYNKALMDEDISGGGCRILIGHTTQRYVSGTLRTRFVEESTLTGKNQVVGIYGVLDQEA